MKKVFYLVAASMLMTSCLKDRAIEAYNEDFVSVFGETDPLHTWKMVDEKTVEVNVDKPSRVKIYVKVDDTYRLAADYENVSGTRTLAFDAPMGCEDISVLVNGVSAQAVNARSGGQSVVQAPAVSVTGHLNITYGEMYNFHKTNSLPERVDNRDKITTTGTNFESVGEGVYSFCPIYWGGTFKHSYGLYYYDENGVKQDCAPFYTNKEDENALLYLNEEKGTFEPVKTDYVKDLFKFPSELEDAVSEKVIFKSPCFSIQVTPGTIFGFYVDTYYASGTFRGRFYTDPELNKENLSKDIFSSFAYLHNDAGTSYISVEDYDDYDYNDFIFILEGEHEHYNEDPIKYMYAVEDLGGTNDFDFNDIVFSVSHVAGKENATVQPLAAGGIYEAEICFKGKSYGEIHDKFGKASNVMVNTAKGTTKTSMVKAEPFLVNVGTTWSHADYQNFSVAVKLPNKPDKVLTIYEPGTDSAPQMLILAENWLWPIEKTSIAEAYSQFSQWSADYTKNTWVNNSNSSKVVNWR